MIDYLHIPTVPTLSSDIIASQYRETILDYPTGTLTNTLHMPRSARNRSYRSIAPNKTWVPMLQSSRLQYSLGLWEIPSLHGTKIIDVGACLDV
jgi:hypothetical protein